MAVIDPQNLLYLERPSLEKKYREFRKTFYIEGKPELKGSLPVRFFDSIILRTFGLILGAGKRLPDMESEYKRLTGNFKRIGKMAKLFNRFGPLGRLMLKLNFGTSASVLVRQGVCGTAKRADPVEVAREYFKLCEMLGFNMEICKRDNDKIEFKVKECPVGYVKGDDLKICYTTMEFDGRCIQKLGGKSIIKEVIPEGASACLLHIVSAGSNVST
jgi:hypothetical protein